MQRLDIHEWAEETEAILERARQALVESRQTEVQSLVQQLAGEANENERPVSLAFAGQYSAGKSTILRALTGREDIATGAGITTEQTQVLDWHGVEVVDTPGIHTSLRPDHDGISYQAISRADLLVFVITNELFDSHIGDHFRKLTIDREKGHETILVVNKMARIGNTRETRAVITEDLRKPLAPFTPEELRITFTDAQSALEASQESEPDIKEILEEEANIGEFILNLNALIQKKGLNARQTTTLYTIDQAMQEAIAAEPTGDPDVDTLILVYNQNIRVMKETHVQMQHAVNNAIARVTEQIQLAGSNCAENFYPGITQEEAERAEKEADERVETLWGQLIEQIERDCTEILPSMGDRLEELHNSQRFQRTINNLNNRSSRYEVNGMLKIAQESAGWLSKLGRAASGNSSAIRSGATGLSQFSGSQAHGAVLNIGRRMGHSFRPWGAVKMARNINRAANILPFVRIGLDIYHQVKEDQEEDRRSEEARRARQDIRLQYSDLAQKVRAKANATAEGYINEILTQPMEQMQEHADRLNDARKEQNQHIQRLSTVSRDARAPIKIIHSTPEKVSPNETSGSCPS